LGGNSHLRRSANTLLRSETYKKVPASKATYQHQASSNALSGGTAARSIFADVPVGLTAGVVLGVAAGMTTGVAGRLTNREYEGASGLFLVACSWLVLRGRLPRQLTTFLADAHARRGVLRQVGAVYQFRHIELQRYLAGRHCAGPDAGTAA
jgi:hypothetical protein